MNTATKTTLGALKLGEPRQHRDITLYPIFIDGNGHPRYRTLAEALKTRELVVTEVGEAGSVPELKVVNRADRSVLLLDGEELKGAKQNRVLNTTILLKEKSETVVPVSCTERGRWAYSSPVFEDSGVVMSRKVRSSKLRSVSRSLEAFAEYSSDQSQVWAEIDDLQARADAKSPTGAMRDVYRARKRDLEEALSRFAVVSGQSGLLVVIDGQTVGFDVVSNPDVYAQLHGKLVKSYVIDALADPAGPKQTASPGNSDAEAFVREAGECEERTFPSVGYGADCRYGKEGLAGAALVHEDRVVHLAFFRLEERETKDSKMVSHQRRRRRFTE